MSEIRLSIKNTVKECSPLNWGYESIEKEMKKLPKMLQWFEKLGDIMDWCATPWEYVN
jgi:hypothetical protein